MLNLRQALGEPWEMSLLPQVDLARVGAKLAVIAAVALVIVSLAWRCSVLGAEAAKQAREVVRLTGELERAGQAVQQAERVNGAMRDAILRLNAENVANQAKASKLEAEASAARRAAAQAAQMARSEDAQRRARLDKPSAAELSAVLRGIVGAM